MDIAQKNIQKIRELSNLILEKLGYLKVTQKNIEYGISTSNITSPHFNVERASKRAAADRLRISPDNLTRFAGFTKTVKIDDVIYHSSHDKKPWKNDIYMKRAWFIDENNNFQNTMLFSKGDKTIQSDFGFPAIAELEDKGPLQEVVYQKNLANNFIALPSEVIVTVSELPKLKGKLLLSKGSEHIIRYKQFGEIIHIVNVYKLNSANDDTIIAAINAL